MLKELHNPTMATSCYLNSTAGLFSWGNTSDDEHFACLGIRETDDATESPFASFSHQLDLGYMHLQFDRQQSMVTSIEITKTAPIIEHITTCHPTCPSH